MNKNSSYFDKFLDYSIVIEQTVDPDKRKIEIIDENKGHPVPDTGSVTIERILTIDPNNISHRIIEYQWPSDNECYGIIDTIYDENGT